MGSPLKTAAAKASARPQEKTARKVLRVDMGEHKAALEAFCAAQDITPSQFVRSTLLAAMDGAAGASKAAGRGQAAGAKKGAVATGPLKRCELLLSQGEIEATKVLAERHGYSFRGYLTAQIRAHLTRSPQFGKLELRALQDSAACMVDAMQEQRRLPGAASAALAEAIKAQLNEIRAVITRNEARWVA